MNPEVESNPATITRTSTDPMAPGTSSSPTGRRTEANSGDVEQTRQDHPPLFPALPGPNGAVITAFGNRGDHGSPNGEHDRRDREAA